MALESFESSGDRSTPDMDIIDHICKNYSLDLTLFMPIWLTIIQRPTRRSISTGSHQRDQGSLHLMCIIWWQPSQRLTSMAPSTWFRRPPADVTINGITVSMVLASYPPCLCIAVLTRIRSAGGLRSQWRHLWRWLPHYRGDDPIC